MNKKIIGMFVIMLFFGAGVLPCVSGNVLNVDTADNNIKDPTQATQVDWVLIGLIGSKTMLGENHYSFTMIIGIALTYIDGEASAYNIVSNFPITFHYVSKIGYFGNFFVCARFFNITPGE
jgi:hypothetical protein